MRNDFWADMYVGKRYSAGEMNADVMRTANRNRVREIHPVWLVSLHGSRIRPHVHSDICHSIHGQVFGPFDSIRLSRCPLAQHIAEGGPGFCLALQHEAIAPLLAGDAVQTLRLVKAGCKMPLIMRMQKTARMNRRTGCGIGGTCSD
jgi:hypothetical protein